MYDLVIRNVRIIDGSSAPWFRGWVGVKGGVIAAVGTGRAPGNARETVDGEDRYLTPGFIDIHAHSDTRLQGCPTADSRILQGVTTEIGGLCGLSVAPVNRDPARLKQLRDYVGDLDYSWETVGQFLDVLEGVGTSTNFGTAVDRKSVV